MGQVGSEVERMPTQADASTPGMSPPSTSPHAISYRISLPYPGGRCYLAILAGREQRSPDRLNREKQQRSWPHTLLSIAIVVGLTATMLMGTMAAAYLAKSMLGIDLLDDHFVLHGLFFG
jgi:hypothetical protein